MTLVLFHLGFFILALLHLTVIQQIFTNAYIFNTIFVVDDDPMLACDSA
jgi:hypothetical protein